MTTIEPADGGGCVRTAAIFVLVASPVYLLLRVVARTARQLYGFDAAPAEPPLVICQRCHNSVLEPGWSHCPYCGAPLSSPDEAAADVAGDGADAATPAGAAPRADPL